MTNISYNGHDILLDLDLEEKIIASMENLLTQDDSFTFYFFMENALSACMRRAVERLKAAHPGLHIQTILVETEEGEASKQYDATVIAPNLDENADVLANIKKAQRWIIEQTDCLLMYRYPGADLEDHSIEAAIQKRAEAGGLAVVDLTSAATLSFINGQVPRLPERQRFVRQGMLAGKTNKELARELSISPSRVQRLYRQACLNLYLLACRATPSVWR